MEFPYVISIVLAVIAIIAVVIAIKRNSILINSKLLQKINTASFQPDFIAVCAQLKSIRSKIGWNAKLPTEVISALQLLAVRLDSFMLKPIEDCKSLDELNTIREKHKAIFENMDVFRYFDGSPFMDHNACNDCPNFFKTEKSKRLDLIKAKIISDKMGPEDSISFLNKEAATNYNDPFFCFTNEPEIVEIRNLIEQLFISEAQQAKGFKMLDAIMSRTKNAATKRSIDLLGLEMFKSQLLDYTEKTREVYLEKGLQIVKSSKNINRWEKTLAFLKNERAQTLIQSIDYAKITAEDLVKELADMKTDNQLTALVLCHKADSKKAEDVLKGIIDSARDQACEVLNLVFGPLTHDA